jgi:hypothetical protein
MLPIILHATESSQQSSFAFGLASSLARNCGVRLIVLHVLETWTDITLAATPEVQP